MDWERIMVQITFAFVIILGYLVSVGVDEVTDLAAEAEQRAAEANELREKMELQEKLNSTLQTIIVELKETEVGKAIAGRVAAEKDLQWEKLLRRWGDLHRKELLQLLETLDPKLIELTTGLECVPKKEDIDPLNEKVKKFFPQDNKSVKEAAIESLTEKVLGNAGLLPPDNVELPCDAAALHFDPKIVADDNLNLLKVQIHKDLLDDRKEVVNLQYELLGRIAAVRKDSLADRDLPDDATIEADAADVGPAMLKKIFDDLEEPIRLLLEVKDMVRHRGRDDPNKPAGSE